MNDPIVKFALIIGGFGLILAFMFGASNQTAEALNVDLAPEVLDFSRE